MTFKQPLTLSLSFLLLLFLVGQTQAWEDRLRYLRSLDVQKNQKRVIETKECRGCYLRGANFRGYDLSDADLEGAVLDRAIWTDGSICQQGSIGQCKKADEEE